MPRSFSGRDLSHPTRVAIAAFAQLAYPLADALLYQTFGDDGFPLAVVPVGLAAWTFGGRVGIAATAFQLLAHAAIVATIRPPGAALLADPPTIALLIIVAVSVGFLHALRLDLLQRAREAEALASATGVLVAGAAAQETLRGILNAAMSVVPSNVASFIVPAEDGQTLRVAAVLGGPTDWVGRTYPASTGISGRAWRNGAVVRVNDVTRDADYVAWTPASRSALAVPVVREGERRGLIYLEDTAPARYRSRDVRIMRAFADHAWIALESADRQHELAAATDRFAAAFNAVPSSLVITRVEDQRIVDANESFLVTTGRTRAEVVGRTTAELGLVDEETSARMGERFAQSGRLINETVETDRLGHGTQYFLVSSDTARIGGSPHIVTVATDVTDRRRTVLEIERLALIDPLTDLPNRNQFTRSLRAAVERAGSAGRHIAVLLLDIDHFKDVNDTFGHRAGDELLHMVGSRLRADLPDDGTVARLGGDEFAFLLEIDAASALRVAETARHSLEIPFELEGHAIVLTGSVGISFFPEHGGNDTVLLQRADIAMYAAKSTRAGTTVYATALDAHSPDRLALAAELRRAVSDGLLEVHFQPIIPLQQGRCFGLEALVRWPHPVRGSIPPAEFIPIAERSGLIKPLTGLVLRRAVAAGCHWVAGGRDVEIAVNVSMHDLRDPQFVDNVARRIADNGVAAERLCLEITESVAMADPDHTLAVLRRLREVGVRIAIDDFGTGYSSLAYLRRLPVDALKIDRGFVAGVDRDGPSTSIVRATIELGHSLGLSVIAEGVEEPAQLARLRELGCDRAQGYLIGRPMVASAVPTWLETQGPKLSA